MNDNADITKTFIQKESDDLEIVEFCIGDRYFGVSIFQVREIVRSSTEIVPVANAHPSILGVINLRREIIPVINLAAHFGLEMDETKSSCQLMITENNENRAGLLVDHVTQIHRIAASDIEPPSELVQAKGECFFGMTKLDERILFLTDFEKVTMDIKMKESGNKLEVTDSEIPDVNFDRSSKKILIVEDSSFMRNLLIQHIKKARYDVISVNNGLEAWQILEGVTHLSGFVDIGQFYHLMITDIEMPQMDGLHLIYNIRSNDKLKKLPCVIFSSLITEDMAEKCVKAGADDQVAKPEIKKLIQIVDNLVIK